MNLIHKLKNPIWWQQTPILTYLLIIINLCIYLMMIVTWGTTETSEVLLQAGAMFRLSIILFGQWWRLFTAGFIHIGVEHLLMNLLSLYFAGIELERITGHWRFLCIYLLSIVGGNALSFALASGSVISAGASTGIFGLFAAYIVLAKLFPSSRYLKDRSQTFTMLIVVNLGLNIFSGTIDMWGHIGGAIFGALATLMVGIPNQDKQSWLKRILVIIAIIALFMLLIFVGFKKI
ncbi:rhomboid family intramembrane serine protease [Aerococcaceae bacterium zg-ZJ1578]|uniref:rhomboid family intramembrane serine protease n=1 Tax=Aerococcaceae bacterium zg-252 TaxID=2796928 RepID=UPI001A1C7104|nr:rhomboid family intramembrane serine protease [Aerococcaceae bacterium zg-1578]